MSQGSTAVSTHNTVTSLAAHRSQTELLQAVREKESLCYAIERIAMMCQDEGHASAEDVDAIQHLARILGRKLHALADEIASN